jgi:RNA polymerase-binding transcription factor DksA
MTAMRDYARFTEYALSALGVRLDQERADLLAQLDLRADDPPDITATTGLGETEHVSSGVEQRVQAAVNARARARLGDLEDALQRIREGSYGRCERCGTEISLARLDAIPEVRLCVRCQQDRDVALRGRQPR